MVDRRIVRIALMDQASLLPERDPRVLVVHKRANASHDGYLEFVGGGIDPGEDGIAALTREVLEELGSPLEQVRYRPIASGTAELEQRAEQQHWSLYVGISPPANRIRLSSEITGFSYLDYDELDRMDRYADLVEQRDAVKRWLEERFDDYKRQLLRAPNGSGTQYF